MRLAVAASALAIPFVVSAPAGAAVVLYDNQPAVNAAGELDGSFSDSMGSGGLTFYSQAVGQGFSFAFAGAEVSALRIWGTSEGATSGGLSGNVEAIEVSIMRITGSSTNYPVVFSKTFQMPSITMTNTGWRVPVSGFAIFQMDIAFGTSVALDPGNYILSAGGVLIDPEDGDAFAWMDGVADGAVAPNRAYLSVGDTAAQWGYWNPVNSGISASMVLYGVPGPGALVLMALAGLRQGRRRD
jgi:hypothetical protein